MDTRLREVPQAELLHFSSEEEVARAVLLGGPVALAVKRFTPETWTEVRAEFLQSVASHRQADGSYRIPGAFVTVSGRKPLI